MEGDDDPLGDALRAVRLVSRFHSRVEAVEPWAADMPPFGDCVSFHLVLAGRCRVEVDDVTVTAVAGEMVLVPHGRGHVLSSGSGVPSVGRVDQLPQTYVTDTYSTMRFDGDGPVTRLLCGIADVDGPAAARLMATLPSLVHVDQRQPSATVQLRSALDLLGLEVERSRPGTAAIAPRIADVVVMLALRWWVQHGAGRDAPWVRALADADVGPVLRAVHDEPDRTWSVADLAQEARMSRSAFAARFREVTGESPMGYVTAWRMQVASSLLREDRSTSILQVARAVGYGSEAAFSRAFSREVGRPPSAVRREPLARG